MPTLRPSSVVSLPALPLFALLALGACGGRPMPAPLPVLSGAPLPAPFTESAAVAPPGGAGGSRAAGAAGSRFAPGWTVALDGRGRRVVTSPEKGGAIELVNVDFLPRTLILEVADGAAPGRKLLLASDHRPLGTFPLAGRIAVDLPRDLPIGRFAIDLEAQPPSPIPLLAVTVTPTLSAGTVKAEGQDVVQAGSSLLYVDRTLANDEAMLVGTFVPPAAPLPGQRFELVLEREDGTPIRRFDWSPSFWNRLRGAREIELPMGDAKGLVHARFRAIGEGPPARWHRLHYSWTADHPGVMSGPAPAAPSPPQSDLPRAGRP